MHPALDRPDRRSAGGDRKILNKTRVKIRNIVRFHRLEHPVIRAFLVRRKIGVNVVGEDLHTAIIVTVRRAHAAVLVIFRHVRDRPVRPKLDRALELGSI